MKLPSLFIKRLKDRILLLADNPYMGIDSKTYCFLRNKNYRMLIINKNIILYPILMMKKEVPYNILVKQDYLQLRFIDV